MRAVRREEAKRQAEQLRVVHVTMRTVQDIVNNCLNQIQLLRLDAEGLVPEESLVLFDEAIRSFCKTKGTWRPKKFRREANRSW